jgi:hypothetical protein
MEQPGNLLPPPVECGSGDLRLMAFVHHIVYFPAESVKGGDSAALLRWEKQKAVIKAGAATLGSVLAIFVRGHVHWRWLLFMVG